MSNDVISLFKESLAQNAPCTHHPEIHRSRSPEEAALWAETVKLCSDTARREHLRWLARNDLFFLCVYLLHRSHFIRNERTAEWTFARCTEVQDGPHNHLDIWPRESFKSEIITFGLTVLEILNDPELTFGIFSHTRPMAKDFLTVIKREFENNEELKDLFPDILWRDPKLDCRSASESWSENDGITVKRKGNPKEATIEAWGLIDGQPTGKRYKRLLYEDVVNRDHVSADMIVKTTQEFENSLLLTASDPPVLRYVATFQEIGDTTQQLMEKQTLKARLHGPLDENGDPAYCSDEKFAWLKQTLSPKVFALQVLLDPAKSKDEHDVGFKPEWLDYYDEMPSRRAMNIYIVADPAGVSKGDKSSSYFAMWVLGLCADRRVRILDAVRDKLDLEESWQALFELVQKWEPIKVGYEKYGMQRDIEHYHHRMRQVNYLFTIVPLSNSRVGDKDQRIGELIPWFRDKRFLFPRSLKKKLKTGEEFDLLTYFIGRELSLWPYNKQQRDMLDALARICDPDLAVVWPRGYGRTVEGEGVNSGNGFSVGGGGTSWMSE